MPTLRYSSLPSGWIVLAVLGYVLSAVLMLAQTEAQTEAQPQTQSQSAAAIAHDLLIKNATLLTVTHGKIEHGSVLVHNGKIAAFGAQVSAPGDATVIDASGKFVTPGLVDCHSHIALDDDVNEATSPVTPSMMMIDAFNSNDKAKIGRA